MKGTEEKRDRAKKEAHVSRLAVVTVGDAKAWAEDDLAQAQCSLAAAKEAKHKAEAKTVGLDVERTSLLLEIRATKDEV